MKTIEDLRVDQDAIGQAIERQWSKVYDKLEPENRTGPELASRAGVSLAAAFAAARELSLVLRWSNQEDDGSGYVAEIPEEEWAAAWSVGKDCPGVGRLFGFSRQAAWQWVQTRGGRP